MNINKINFNRFRQLLEMEEMFEASNQSFFYLNQKDWYEL